MKMEVFKILFLLSPIFVLVNCGKLFKNCTINETDSSCVTENYLKVINLTFLGNGKQMRPIDELIVNDESVAVPKIGGNLTKFTVKGIANLIPKKLIIERFASSKSFMIGSANIHPRMIIDGNYKLDWKLGLFHFNANGKAQCDDCERNIFNIFITIFKNAFIFR